jgi:hypothetical protein
MRVNLSTIKQAQAEGCSNFSAFHGVFFQVIVFWALTAPRFKAFYRRFGKTHFHLRV